MNFILYTVAERSSVAIIIRNDWGKNHHSINVWIREQLCIFVFVLGWRFLRSFYWTLTGWRYFLTPSQNRINRVETLNRIWFTWDFVLVFVMSFKIVVWTSIWVTTQWFENWSQTRVNFDTSPIRSYISMHIQIQIRCTRT